MHGTRWRVTRLLLDVEERAVRVHSRDGRYRIEVVHVAFRRGNALEHTGRGGHARATHDEDSASPIGVNDP